MKRVGSPLSFIRPAFPPIDLRLSFFRIRPRKFPFSSVICRRAVNKLFAKLDKRCC